MSNEPALHDPAKWDEMSRDYEALAEPFTGRFGIQLAEAAGSAAGERVIDIACGTGALALHLAARGVKVTAIDHSPAMIARLCARAAEEGLDIDARAADALALPFEDGIFDASLSAFGIFLFPDNEAGLREAVRVTRPGGTVAIATWQGDFGAGPSLLLHGTFRKVFPDRPIRLPSAGAAAWGKPDVLARAMVAAGLDHVRVTASTMDWVFASAQSVIEHAERLFKVFPSWAELDEAERGTLVAALMDELGAGDAPSVPSTALLAIGSKR